MQEPGQNVGQLGPGQGQSILAKNSVSLVKVRPDLGDFLRNLVKSPERLEKFVAKLVK